MPVLSTIPSFSNSPAVYWALPEKSDPASIPSSAGNQISNSWPTSQKENLLPIRPLHFMKEFVPRRSHIFCMIKQGLIPQNS